MAKSKGVTVRMMVLAFIAALALVGGIILYGGIETAQGGILQDILGIGGQYGNPADTAKMQAAIKCAYYRCKEGCSGKVENIAEGDFTCLNFCTELSTYDTNPHDGKICDDESKRYPIKVSLGDDSWISASGIGGDITSGTISSFDKNVVQCEDMRPSYPLPYVSKDKILESKDSFSCPYHMMMKPCYDSVKLSKGKYYIWSHEITVVVSAGVATLVCEDATLPPLTEVELFQDTAFGGTSKKITKDSNYIGDAFNDRVSSVKVPKLWKVELYEHADYAGRKITLAGDSSYLNSAETSSIKFSPTSCGATMYSMENKGGTSKYVSGNQPDLTANSGQCSGSWNDCIRSISVIPGCTATLYQHVNYQGEYTTVSGDSSSMSFDNMASSIKVFKSG